MTTNIFSMNFKKGRKQKKNIIELYMKKLSLLFVIESVGI